MTIEYNIGRKLTRKEMDKLYRYLNAEVTQDSDGNVARKNGGQPISEETIREALASS